MTSHLKRWWSLEILRHGMLLFPIYAFVLHRLGAPQFWQLGLLAVAMFLFFVQGSQPFRYLELALCGVLVTLLALFNQQNLVRLYPFLMALHFFLAFTFEDRKGTSFIEAATERFKKLTPFERATLRQTIIFWQIGLGTNAAILGVFLLRFSFESWALYAGVISYGLLGLLFLFTVVYLRIAKHQSESSRILLAVRYYCIHTVSFFIFGVMCLAFLLLLPLNFLTLLGPRGFFTKFNRAVCQHSFKFVLWFCRKVHFLDVSFFDEAQGDYGKIIIANHISMFDVVCMLAHFRFCGTYINGKFLFNPLLTANVLCSGYIPIAQSLTSKANGFRKSMHQLAQGLPFLIFPEGTRTKTGTLGAFANGPFHLALESRSDITPVFLTLDRPFLNNTTMFRVPYQTIHLNVHVFKKISVQSLPNSRQNLLELKERVYSLYLEKVASAAALPWNRRPFQHGHA